MNPDPAAAASSRATALPTTTSVTPSVSMPESTPPSLPAPQPATTPDEVTIGLVSISDRASSGVYDDEGLPALKAWLSWTNSGLRP